MSNLFGVGHITDSWEDMSVDHPRGWTDNCLKPQIKKNKDQCRIITCMASPYRLATSCRCWTKLLEIDGRCGAFNTIDKRYRGKVFSSRRPAVVTWGRRPKVCREGGGQRPTYWGCGFYNVNFSQSHEPTYWCSATPTWRSKFRDVGHLTSVQGGGHSITYWVNGVNWRGSNTHWPWLHEALECVCVCVLGVGVEELLALTTVADTIKLSPPLTEIWRTGIVVTPRLIQSWAPWFAAELVHIQWHLKGPRCQGPANQPLLTGNLDSSGAAGQVWSAMVRSFHLITTVPLGWGGGLYIQHYATVEAMKT